MATELTIITQVERRRGCGYRKPGGLYFVSAAPMRPCGKLPIELTVCPCCHGGIKPARGWTWIDPRPLIAKRSCGQGDICGLCLMGGACPGRAGLLWVGEAFYPTPAHYMRESLEQGLSRRIAAIPKDFKVGLTVVWMAHRKAIVDELGNFVPGVFTAFIPERIDYVVKADDKPEKLHRLVRRGVTLVNVIPDEPVETALQQEAI